MSARPGVAGLHHGTEQGVIMRVGGRLIIGVAIGLSATLAAARAQDATAQEKALLGTYLQNQACKGDSSDPAKKLVTIGDKQVDSNFGPCTFGTKTWTGKVLKAPATCKNKAGNEFEVSLMFTLNDNDTVDFVEEGSQYKSVLHRCPSAPAK
jgi:hypothetical protein